MVTLGIEHLLTDERSLVADKRLGLITNPSGIDSEFTSTIDRLHAADGVDLVRLFGPEHGIRGREQAGVQVADSTDTKTGLPVKSLYGDTNRPNPDDLADLDVLVYHMQDTGCRFYTRNYILAYALERAAETDTKFVVLDRPNPIAPIAVAGNRVPDEQSSFVGDYRLPIVHGMTLGELARYVNGEFGIEADLEVVELDGWSKDTWYDETDLPWVPPSPNMPTLTTAILYPGTCFFEGTTLSEGRGTTNPFEYVGAPWIDGEVWSHRLESFEIPGVAFRPVYFTPMFSKHEGTAIEGVHVHVVDREAIHPVEVGLTMLVSAFVDFDGTAWAESNGSFPIDRLAGGDYLRKLIDASTNTHPVDVVEQLLADWAAELEAFRAIRATYERYD